MKQLFTSLAAVGLLGGTLCITSTLQAAGRDDLRPERPRLEKPHRSEAVTKAERPQKVERIERAEKPEKPEKPQKPERLERPEKPERPGHR